MPDFDIAMHGPLRVGITSAGRLWLNIPGDIVRVRGTDLRDVSRKATDARDERPGAAVLVDIDVTIASEARAAREIHADSKPSDGGQTLLYVGTPTGLAGLITDIHTLGIADGAVLIPTSPGVRELIVTDVLPALTASTRVDVAQARPA